MQKRFICLFLLLFPVLAGAQFVDQFDDGDFTSNPSWSGDVNKFVVDDGMLRLNDNEAGQAYLATESQIIHNTQWEFWVRLAFTPTNNNHPRIYLVSDSHDLSGPLNGYYLRIGKDGGDNKRLYFYRQDGTTDTELLAGSTNIATSTNNRLRIRVTRDQEGNWAFFADPSGGNLFSPQGTVHDNTYTATSWFGVRCLYTVSNANRFYFDDFFVGEIIPDTDPPEVEMVQVASSNSLVIHFNEVVDAVTAENTSHYHVDGGIGHPMIASLDQSSPNVVSILFADHFEENRLYTIAISQVEDISGNAMAPFETDFVYYIAQRFDVVFNELMIDPTPVVGLPAHEYIELYNTTLFPIDLEGWVLQHGTTRRSIPVAVIPPKGLLLLVTEAAFPFFEHKEHVVAVPGLSATALTNAGTDLLLFDQQDHLISFVSYTDEWYQDQVKRNGGWSLEKIDPYNFCQGMENWMASVDSRGGTPGLPNSILASNPDETAPRLLRAGVEDTNTIVLYFSEPMDEEGMANVNHFNVQPNIGTATAAEPLLPDFSRVRLSFGVDLQQEMTYEVEASPQVTDCAGNPLAVATVRVGLPSSPEPNDVVINEVLFNPPDRGARYIELYNRSNKVIDLKDCMLASYDTIGGHFITIQQIASESYLFFPDDYLVFTQSPEAVLNTFMTPNPEAFIRMAGMPRMTNANGILVFGTRSLEIIDKFIYEENMHLPLLTTYKGVALERLNPQWPTQDPSNWHSAAQGAGFGTPGYKNSQYTMRVEAEKGTIEVYPEVFSPDGDGHDDLLNIAYAFDQPGYVANIRIFDSRGRLVRNLRRGELLATSGVVTWDGTTDDMQKAPVGIYVIHLEIFDLGGGVENYRKTAVLGGRF